MITWRHDCRRALKLVLSVQPTFSPLALHVRKLSCIRHNQTRPVQLISNGSVDWKVAVQIIRLQGQGAARRCV